MAVRMVSDFAARVCDRLRALRPLLHGISAQEERGGHWKVLDLETRNSRNAISATAAIAITGTRILFKRRRDMRLSLLPNQYAFIDRRTREIVPNET